MQNSLKEKLLEFQKDFDDIRENYFETDDTGEFRQEDGNLIWLDKYKDNREEQANVGVEIEELTNEYIIIDLTEHEERIKSFYTALTEDKFTVNEEVKDDNFELMVEVLEKAINAEEGE